MTHQRVPLILGVLVSYFPSLLAYIFVHLQCTRPNWKQNKIGPKIYPWGIPQVRGAKDDVNSRELFVKSDLNQFKTVP